MRAGRTSPLLWGATALGAAGMLAAYFVSGAPRFWANWLVWYLFLLSVALGALFLVALEHLVAARWSVPLRRIPERLACLLIPLAGVGLAALGAIPVLYPGARPEAAAEADSLVYRRILVTLDHTALDRLAVSHAGTTAKHKGASNRAKTSAMRMKLLPGTATSSARKNTVAWLPGAADRPASTARSRFFSYSWGG